MAEDYFINHLFMRLKLFDINLEIIMLDVI
ncbi:hypothetical protein Aeqsu_3153 [Aequorivita sublithincola DSM 14238]|uniref:Uncharacterized protein n=1 Tax=Aequorivita sublithincola (strain DSM 14238 / LMG 21431 / ACAM 643 / 9-3) TaxID=746697 RepID=I3Z020_AEQSU|nr:hypothetical protein Aeqsu_3153 [Aequorivita sublithincola DSM 14238]